MSLFVPALKRVWPHGERHAPWILVVMLSAWLLWPVPTGTMPMSADHTVHLTRIWMWAQQLAQGHVRGWSSVWFFGTPVGELYPVLGDAVVIGVRALSLGVLDWADAYAIGFFVVFTVQGLAMVRVGRACGAGAGAGLVAAVLLLCDVGAYREGGWQYTVEYGVWPQALSTALTWLAFGEVLLASTSYDDGVVRRRIATAALAFAGSLLAHPMAMLSTAIGGPLLVVTLGMGGREALRRASVHAVLAAGLGLLIAAWWLVPMFAHRGWMASYGWMWRSLSWMGHQAAEGHLTQAMPAGVGATIALGAVLVAVAGSRPTRFLVAFGLVLWAMASSDAMWNLRLDQLSSGFAHIQYQRFIIAAKPGLFLAAGFGLRMLAQWGAWLWRYRGSSPARAATAIALWLGVVGAVAWMAQGTRAAVLQSNVGNVQTERLVGVPQREADFTAVTQWARLQRQQSERPWRMTFDAPRNAHWFMDAPVYTGVPTYKQGFTPGDNFVHKPESGRGPVLDRLGVRYVVKDRGRSARSKTVAEFGALRVVQRPQWHDPPIAWVQGPGAVHLDEVDVDGGVVRGRLEGTQGQTRLVFAIAGFPRWTLWQDGQQVEWFEVPVLGTEPIATQADRHAGRLQGGKADGDDGSEPTLLAADLGDGTFELRYRSTTGVDVVASLLSLMALLATLVLLRAADRTPRATRWLASTQKHLAWVGRPITVVGLGVLALVLATIRWQAGAANEGVRAVGWVADGRAQVTGRAHTRPFKTDMLIQPAVVITPRRGPTTLTFPAVDVGDTLRGWVAIDDDASKLPRQGSHQITIEFGQDGQWHRAEAWKVPHRGGTSPIALPLGDLAGRPVDVRVTVDSDGDKPPSLGLDLTLRPEVPDDAP